MTEGLKETELPIDQITQLEIISEYLKKGSNMVRLVVFHLCIPERDRERETETERIE